ncbi:2-oxoglutarate dehydrogenase E1 component [Kappamyces sp. JEL0680]|nr:2-oxoglutarate dehydrogenase E1 component [Kappamyces sp. JEL0680]
MAKSAIGEMTEDTRFQRLIPEVLHPNALEPLLTADPATGLALRSYAGNNTEPRIPYSLVKDPVSSPASSAPATAQEDGFTLLPPDQIKTLIFCSGQVYYLLNKTRALNNLRHIAIVRIEQLNPFPFWECKTIVDYYSASLEEIVYCQEESFNSGAWSFVEPRLTTAVEHSEWFKTDKAREWLEKLRNTRCSGGLENARCENNESISIRGGYVVRYAGRDISAAPATGIKKQHKFEEKMLVSEALLGGKLVYPPAKVEGEIPVFYN